MNHPDGECTKMPVSPYDSLDLELEEGKAVGGRGDTAISSCRESGPAADMGEPPPAPPGCLGVRHLQAVLLFLGLVIAYSERVNLSVGIVAMTHNDTNPDFETVDWSSAEQGTVLSSFFYGYLVTQVPAGQLAGKYGASLPLGLAMIFNGVTTLLLPMAARYSFLAACAARVLQGMGQGFIYPSCNTLMSKWAVPQERGRIYSFVFGGTQFGTILVLIVGGLLAASSGGWPSIFYVTGGLSVAWGILCVFLVSDSPAKHKSISQKEREYIESSLIGTASQEQRPATPWLGMLKSGPLWALLVVHCAQNWGFWTLLTLMPTFFSNVLNFDIKKNGFLSALPYFAMWLTSFLFSIIADFLVKRGYFSFGVSRKFWNSVALYGGAVALAILAWVDTTTTSAIVLLTVAVGLNAGTYSGYMLNHLDLSPNFAGTLMGITNGFANVTSILAPTIAGLILTDNRDASQWKIVFLIAAIVSVVGETLFNIFGSGEVQPWNAGPKKKEDPESVIKGQDKLANS